MMRHLLRRLKRFGADRRGNVAVIVALGALPMLGLMGLAIDYTLATSAKSKLDVAQDAAAIAAITKAQAVIAANLGATGTALSDGQAQGQAAFRANAGSINYAAVPVPTLSVTRNGQVLTATVSYATSTQNQFGSLFGVSSTAVKGTATASLRMPSYVGIYMALDISQSMGIGATQTDMNNLFALTSKAYGPSKGCVFGCHVPQSWQTVSNESIAHTNGVSLRIDSLRSAVLQNVTDAIATEQGTSLYQIGLYTMGAQNASMSSIGLNTLIGVTTDLNAVKTAANQIDLGLNNSSGVGDTNFVNALSTGTASNPNAFDTLVPASGDGTTLARAVNYAMIITDGVQDVYGSTCVDGHCTSAFDPALCAALKAKGVTVQVLYTTYLPFPNEQTYVDLVQKPGIDVQIQPNLQACASSPANFYQASDAAGIAAAMQAMFAQATKAAALVN